MQISRLSLAVIPTVLTIFLSSCGQTPIHEVNDKETITTLEKKSKELEEERRATRKDGMLASLYGVWNTCDGAHKTLTQYAFLPEGRAITRRSATKDSVCQTIDETKPSTTLALTYQLVPSDSAKNKNSFDSLELSTKRDDGSPVLVRTQFLSSGLDGTFPNLFQAIQDPQNSQTTLTLTKNKDLFLAFSRGPISSTNNLENRLSRAYLDVFVSMLKRGGSWGSSCARVADKNQTESFMVNSDIASVDMKLTFSLSLTTKLFKDTKCTTPIVGEPNIETIQASLDGIDLDHSFLLSVKIGERSYKQRIKIALDDPDSMKLWSFARIKEKPLTGGASALDSFVRGK